MSILLNILVSGIIVVIVAYIIPGVQVDSYFTAIIVAIILSVINSIIGPLLKILTIPPDVLNLWLISVIINILMVLLVARFVPGFSVSGFGVALIFGAILSLVGTGFSLEPRKKIFR